MNEGLANNSMFHGWFQSSALKKNTQLYICSCPPSMSENYEPTDFLNPIIVTVLTGATLVDGNEGSFLG